MASAHRLRCVPVQILDVPTNPGPAQKTIFIGGILSRNRDGYGFAVEQEDPVVADVTIGHHDHGTAGQCFELLDMFEELLFGVLPRPSAPTLEM